MISQPRDRLKNAIANSLSFQTLTGTVGHPELAAKRIHVDAVSPDPKEGENYTPEELQAIRPYALIYYGDEGFQWQRDAMGTAVGSVCEGQTVGELSCELYRNTPEGNAQEVAISFIDMMEGIAREVIAQSETGGLFIQGFSFNGPYRTSEEEYAKLGDSQGALMTFMFGNSQS